LPRWLVVGLPALVAALLILPGLDRIPGLNGDEGWTFERIDELERGLRPWNGMTFYVSGMHQYLVWPFVEWLGRNPFAVRLPGALLTVAAIALITWAMLRRFGGPTALAAGLLLATAPIQAKFGRFGTEVPALSPFFAAVAFACFMALRRDRGWRELGLAVGGGLFMGLLALNHVVLLPISVTLVIVLLVAYRQRFFTAPITYAAILGFLLGVSRRLYEITVLGLFHWWLNEGKPSDWASDLLPMLSLLGRTWDGAIVYTRMTGGNAVFVVPYPELALVALFVLRAWAKRQGVATVPVRWLSRIEAHALLGVLVAAALTTRLAPHLSIRYAIIIHTAIPVVFALLSRPLLEAAVPRVRQAGLCTIAVVLGLNLFYLTVNYYVPFLTHDGGIAVFPVGTRLIETSSHFARTDGLYRQLRARGVRRVETNNFIMRPLRMYDHDHALEFGGVEPAVNSPGRAVVRTAVVFYNGPQWWGPDPPMPTEDSRTFGDTIIRAGLKLRLDPSFPVPFRVYIVEPPPLVTDG
jgi:4-amino-4-deoxy-L-arabinose transferase-like glycosyltransferase